MEVLGLIPSAPDLRPADVLTTAAQPNKTSVVDVGTTAPHASGAGEDCVETMRQHKLQKYAKYVPELTSHDIEYDPATINAYER